MHKMLALAVALGFGCGGGKTDKEAPTTEGARSRAEAAGKRAVEQLERSTAEIAELKTSLGELDELIKSASAARDDADNDAERAGANAKLGSLRDQRDELALRLKRLEDERADLVGGSTKGERIVDEMEGFTRKMCNCQDKACADKVNEDMNRWGIDLAKNGRADEKPDARLAKRSTDIMTKYSECMTKLMMAGAAAAQAEVEPPPD